MPRGVSIYDEARLQRQLWTPENGILDTAVAWWDARYVDSLAINGSSLIWRDRISGILAKNSNSNFSYSLILRNNSPAVRLFGNYLNFTPPAAFPSGSAAGWIFVSGYSESSGGQYYFFGYGTSSNLQQRCISQNGGNVTTTSYSGDTNTGLPWYPNDRSVFWDIRPSAQTIYVDGSLISSNTFNLNTTLATGRIGSNLSGGENLTGSICQILVGSGTLTDRIRTLLFGWDSWANGKSGSNLPVSHPYKNRPPLIGD